MGIFNLVPKDFLPASQANFVLSRAESAADQRQTCNTVKLTWIRGEKIHVQLHGSVVRCYIPRIKLNRMEQTDDTNIQSIMVVSEHLKKQKNKHFVRVSREMLKDAHN